MKHPRICRREERGIERKKWEGKYREPITGDAGINFQLDQCNFWFKEYYPLNKDRNFLLDFVENHIADCLHILGRVNNLFYVGYVCLYICVHVCMHTCTHIHMCSCAKAQSYSCKHRIFAFIKDKESSHKNKWVYFLLLHE